MLCTNPRSSQFIYYIESVAETMGKVDRYVLHSQPSREQCDSFNNEMDRNDGQFFARREKISLGVFISLPALMGSMIFGFLNDVACLRHLNVLFCSCRYYRKWNEVRRWL
jgi:hypothetical protein